MFSIPHTPRPPPIIMGLPTTTADTAITATCTPPSLIHIFILILTMPTPLARRRPAPSRHPRRPPPLRSTAVLMPPAMATIIPLMPSPAHQTLASTLGRPALGGPSALPQGSRSRKGGARRSPPLRLIIPSPPRRALAAAKRCGVSSVSTQDGAALTLLPFMDTAGSERRRRLMRGAGRRRRRKGIGAVQLMVPCCGRRMRKRLRL